MRPGPGDDADGPLRDLVARGRRVIAVVMIVQGALLIALIAVVVNLYSQSQVNRPCTFFADIGNSPVSPVSSKLGVTIVEDSRAQFVIEHCAGALAPPGAELARLARKYGIPLRY